MTRYPIKRPLDSSLHLSIIAFYLFQPNHQSVKHRPGLNLECPIPLSVLPAPSPLSQELNIIQTPIRSEDNDVIKEDSYQPALITTILSDKHCDQTAISINNLESPIIQIVHHCTESKKSQHYGNKINSRNCSLKRIKMSVAHFSFYLSLRSRVHKRMTGKSQQSLSSSFPSVPSTGIVSP